MKLSFKKSSLEVRLVGVFILFILFFTFFRMPIANGAAWMLAMTREISLTDDDNSPEDQRGLDAKKRKLQQRKKRAQKKKATVSNPGKPQRRKLPKTSTPIVLFSHDSPSWDDTVFAAFPKMRRHTGKAWDNENTEIRMSTDGTKLFILARLYDKYPDKAITRYSKAQARSAWQDDGVEVFLMKNKSSKIYIQYVMSVSGIGYAYYIKTTKVPSRGTTADKPKNFVLPGFYAEKFKNYFDLEMTIDLSNIGIVDLATKDSFLIQIVRNYRGQGRKDSVTLHLFPSHIYADRRFGIINHDRRAFQPVKIIDTSVYSTMDKTDKKLLKNIK